LRQESNSTSYYSHREEFNRLLSAGQGDSAEAAAGHFSRISLDPADFVYADPPYDVEFASIQRTAFRGETARNEFVSEVLDVDGRHVLVEHIPAQVCTRCGEAAFSRETTERIRLLVRGAHRPADSQFAPLHNPQSLVRDYVAGFTDERFKARYLKLAAALDRACMRPHPCSHRSRRC